MLDFQVPRISSESVEENRGSFRSSLSIGVSATRLATRCAVCCSRRWPAPLSPVSASRAWRTSSPTIKGVKEDVTDIVLNLKGVVCRMHSDATEVEAPLVVSGPGEITAKDIDLPSGVEILNPDAQHRDAREADQA